MLPALYVLMVAFSLVAGIALLAALSRPAFPSRVCFLLELHFSLSYFILFFSADRDKSSS